MNCENKNEKKEIINFENISFEEIQEVDEIVTALFGTQECCKKEPFP